MPLRPARAAPAVLALPTAHPLSAGALRVRCRARRAKESASAAVSAKLKEVMKKLGALDQTANAQGDVAEEAAIAVESAQKDIEGVQKRAANRAAKVQRLERELEEARAQLARAPTVSKNVAELNDIRLQMRAETDMLRRAEDELTDAEDAMRVPADTVSRSRIKLAQFDDLRTQRCTALRNLRPGPNRGLQQAMDAVARLRSERKFEHDVFGPLLSEVAVNNPQYAACLEQHVPVVVWSMFVTQSASDRDLLLQATKGLNISVTNYTGDVNAPVAHPVPLASLQKLGVMTTLDAVFDAPPLVKAALNNQCGLSRAYVGGAEADRNAAAIMAQVPVLWTPTNQYVSSGSSYSNERYTRLVPTRPPRLLTSNANPAERASVAELLVRARMQSHPPAVCCAAQG